jgi:hypothetical protein
LRQASEVVTLNKRNIGINKPESHPKYELARDYEAKAIAVDQTLQPIDPAAR